MDGSKIEWTDATWNPLRGCSRVSEGCRNCYAEKIAVRFGGPGMPYDGTTQNGKWNGKIKLVPDVLEAPLRWKRPRRIFVNSMSDLFHENMDDVQIERILLVMMQAPQHIFQVLTKRAERMQKFLSGFYTPKAGGWPLPNVWYGVSVEDQAAADKRIPLLLQTPAAVRWISAEPLLGPLILHKPWMGYMNRMSSPTPQLNWIVTGGESGPGARPCSIAWIKSIVDQCAMAGVSCFVKQVGSKPYDWAGIGDDGVGIKRTHNPKGGDMMEWPEKLRAREFPAVEGAA